MTTPTGDRPCPDCLTWIASLGRDMTDHVARIAADLRISQQQVRADLLTAYHRTHTKEWLQ